MCRSGSSCRARPRRRRRAAGRRATSNARCPSPICPSRTSPGSGRTRSCQPRRTSPPDVKIRLVGLRVAVHVAGEIAAVPRGDLRVEHADDPASWSIGANVRMARSGQIRTRERIQRSRSAFTRARLYYAARMRLGIDFGTTRTVVAAVRRRPPSGRRVRRGRRVPRATSRASPRCAAASCSSAGRPRARSPTAAPSTRSARSSAWSARSRPTTRSRAAAASPRSSWSRAFLAELRRALVERSNLELDPRRAARGHGRRAGERGVAPALAHARGVPRAPASRRSAWSTSRPPPPIEFAHRHLARARQARARSATSSSTTSAAARSIPRAVSLEGRRFDLIASEGLARLGGDDFDELDPRRRAASAARRAAPSLERAREAKETLRPTTKKLLLDLGAAWRLRRSTSRTSTRAREPLIERTIAQTELLFDRLRDARHRSRRSARARRHLPRRRRAPRFPPVARALRARFGKKLQLAPQPFAATAVGLAIAADPDAHVMIREAVTRHFGVWREAEGGADKVFDPLIGKDADAPTTIAAPLPPDPRGRPPALPRVRRARRRRPAGAGPRPLGRHLLPVRPALADRAELATVPNERRPDLMTNEIAETYTYAPDGTISVAHRERVARLRAHVRARRAALTIGTAGGGAQTSSYTRQPIIAIDPRSSPPTSASDRDAAAGGSPIRAR